MCVYMYVGVKWIHLMCIDKYDHKLVVNKINGM